MKIVKQRIKKIQSIANRMTTAKDVKEAQDLGNAMQTQIALLQTDKIQADIEKNTEELNEKLIEKQRQDEIERRMNNFTSPW